MSRAAFGTGQEAGGLVSGLARRGATWWAHYALGQKALAVGLVVMVVGLVTYNLAANPQTWFDEGAALGVARTLATDGVYAMRSAEGYQSYGAVQSVGPTVILPVALSFKLFGIGLVQGRLVAVLYLLLAIWLMYQAGVVLFGRRAALLAGALLLGAPTAHFLHFGRQVLGEVPALAWLLGGWLVWAQGVRTGRRWLYPLAGLLLGAAMVTKLQFILFIFAALFLVGLLDRFFYRQRATQGLLIIGAVAGACVVLWFGWQFAYFGPATFFENLAKLRALSAATNHFAPRTSAEAINWLFGRDSGYFYFFFGLPALMYGVFLSLRRTREGLLLAFLLLFTLLAWAYWLFWFIPVAQYAVTPAALTALFVAKFGHDLTQGALLAPRSLWAELRTSQPGRMTVALPGTVLLALMILYTLQSVVRADVAGQHRDPQAVAAFLDASVPPDAVIETWHREFAILSDRRYHYPDSELLARIHTADFRGGPRDYFLGANYFQASRPDYLVVGLMNQPYDVYDGAFVDQHGRLIASIGGYRIYQLALPAPGQQRGDHTAAANSPIPAGLER